MHVALSPLSWCLLVAVVLALSWRRLPRVMLWSAAILGGLLFALLCPIGANALVWQIESRVPAADTCAGPAPATIVVLSAGLQREPESSDDLTALHAESVERAMAGIALWRRTPDANLVFAGGGPFAISESALLQRFAEQAGVPAQTMRREERSQTTWENALQLRALVPALSQRIWLVSSAIHLPRALTAFRSAGFQPCPYVSDRRYLPPGGIGYFLPQSSALIKSETAIHELVGEAVYRWRAARASP